MTARRVLTVGVLAMGAALALPARAADPDPAQAFFDQGLADMEAGRFEKACPAIEQSYKLDPSPGTLFTLAECEAKRGRTATALGRYQEYLALYARLPPERRAKQGDRDQVSLRAMTTLGPQVPELTVRLSPSAPPGTRVTRDGAQLSESALGVPMQLDPGEHVFTLHPPGGPVTERRVSMSKGDKKAILLDLKLEAPPAAVAPKAPPPIEPPAPAKDEDHGPSGRRIGAFVVGGIGVAGVLVGAITGGLAIGKKSTVDSNCGSGIHSADSGACNSTGLSAANSMQTLGIVSDVGFALGAVGLVTGVVLFATEPKAKPSSSAGSTRRVGVQVTPLGTAGAAATLKGTW